MHDFTTRYWLASFTLLALGGCVLEEGEPTESVEDQEIIGGTYTRLRPEIGALGIYGGCTGTLVDPRFVVTAGHCIKYTTANVGGTFTITRSNGTTATYNVDKTFALGRGNPNNLKEGLGESDVALVRLATPVAITDAAPTFIASSWPGAGIRQTIFGYGCQNRETGAGGGSKQYVEFIAGEPSSRLCPGDSGGPVVWGGATSGGGVFAINSGYGSGGGDIFGDASFHAIPGLEAVKRFADLVVTNFNIASFAGWAATPGVKAVSGDFNGDGLGDMALVGGQGWSTLPIAFGNGNGTFWVSNVALPGDSSTWAQQASQAVAGDFNRDGKTDIALFGGPGWITIPIAFSQGTGAFSITNYYNTDFASWARTYGAQVVGGDFNNDSLDDLALVGGSGWTTIPVAFSNGNGTFNNTNKPNATFQSWAQPAWYGRPVQAVAGDYDGDGDADIALVGGIGWTTIPVAFSDKTGGFSITNNGVAHFPDWVTNSWNTGLKVVSGDFDGDGKTDLAMTGGESWITIAFALSQGGGSFTAANQPINNFPLWTQQAKFLLSGAFKDRRRYLVLGKDLRRDLAILGGTDWHTVPVAFLRN